MGESSGRSVCECPLNFIPVTNNDGSQSCTPGTGLGSLWDTPRALRQSMHCPVHSTVLYCIVLHSNVQFCGVMLQQYSTVMGFLETCMRQKMRVQGADVPHTASMSQCFPLCLCPCSCPWQPRCAPSFRSTHA